MSTPNRHPIETETSESDSATDTAAKRLPRRTVLAAAGVVGAAGVLAACGGSDSDTASDAEPDTTTDVPDDSAAIASVGDVPVGGAIFVESRSIVVAQPNEGVFKAFQARCPHQGCMTSETENENLLCPCHGSLFSSETGEVLRGPAMSGLPEEAIEVVGTDIIPA